jgi:hypothetical protein
MKTKRKTIAIDATVHRKIRVLCAQRGVKIRDWVDAVLEKAAGR